MLAGQCETAPSLAALILRLGLAAIFIVHGNIKISVDFDVAKEMSRQTQHLVGWVELACGVMLLLGLLSRLAALAVASVQAGAIYLISGRHAMEGLRFGTMGADYLKVGPEYNLVLICMSLAVIVLGSGVFSMDACLEWMFGGKPKEAAPGAPAPVTSSP